MDALERKMRRRIKRQIATGEHQPRVRQVDDVTFDYHVKHYVEVVRFRVSKNGRLMKQKSS